MSKKITVLELIAMKERGERIAMLTAYNYQLAKLADMAGIPILLVGDSVGMVEAGMDSTLPVTIEEMIYHTRSVRRGALSALVITDMPFMSYQASIEDAVRNAGRLVKEGGAECVKVEGGLRSVGAIRAIVSAEIPVMGHIGLTPQSVHRMGGYRVQGRGEAGEVLIEDALAIEEAGAIGVVLEGIPTKLAGRITRELTIPTIGIGAGGDLDGQVLVINDMLGLSGGTKPPRFVKQYASLDKVITGAIKDYKKEVLSGKFPAPRHGYK